MASNNTASLDEIRSIFCSTVSMITVWRTLKANPFIRRKRMRKCPTLTADLKRTNMDFYVLFHSGHLQWRKEILPQFAIEFSSYWRDLRKECSNEYNHNISSCHACAWGVRKKEQSTHQTRRVSDVRELVEIYRGFCDKLLMEADSFDDDWDVNFESNSDDSFNESVTMSGVFPTSQTDRRLRSTSKLLLKNEIKSIEHSLCEDSSVNNLPIDSFELKFNAQVSSPDVNIKGITCQEIYNNDSSTERFGPIKDEFNSHHSWILNEDILRNDVRSLRNILQAAVVNKTFSATDVERAVAICSMTTSFDCIASVLSGGLRRIITDPNDVDKQVLTAIFKLVAKSKYNSEVYVRARSCLLMQNLLSAGIEEDEVYETDEYDGGNMNILLWLYLFSDLIYLGSKQLVSYYSVFYMQYIVIFNIK
uniref:WAPL domain-containing protein n=1 Tax=Heterorhabditis bacteriophora TaxID=37862 RepID=A0A1I7WCA5_HETBA